MINKPLRDAVKLSNMKAYEIAHRAGLHHSTMSRILCGIELVKRGDPRVIAIGKVLGIAPEDCFTPDSE